MFTFAFLYGHRALTRFSILLAALAALAASGWAQVGLGLAPMREDLRLAPFGSHSGVLTLVNNAPQKVRVRAEIVDFYLDASATPQFGIYPRESEFSCRQWLVANPMELELNPKANVPVRYTVRVPESATPRSYHCAIAFTTMPTAEETKTIGLRTAVEIVGAIYVVVGQPSIEGVVKELKLEYVADLKDAAWRAVVTINNSGLMHIRPQGDLDVLDAGGSVIEKIPFAPLPVLPKRDQNFLFPLKLPSGPGQYTLRARVDLGGDEIQEATALVVATKPSR
jgi:hypothetical protein